MHELLQSDTTTQQVKESFHDLCVIHNYHFHALKALAEVAGVGRNVVNKMYLGTSVRRREAQAVLKAFSAATGETYTLGTVEVALLPTFAHLHKQYTFDLDGLATGADVPFAIVDMLLHGQKVTKHAACQVLTMASHHIHMPLTLENTDVPVFDEEAANE